MNPATFRRVDRGVRFLSILAPAGLVVLGFGLGCEPNADWQDRPVDYVRTEPVGQIHQALGVEGDPLFLYLNFCREDCTFRPGPDDARLRTSGIVSQEVTLPESVLSDEEYDDLVRCLYQIFEPFEVVIGDERPVDGRYVEAVIAGRARDLGLSPTIAGISPLACGLIEYGINFSFFNQISRQDGIGELCNVIAHETGHTIGLEHAYLCSDVMTYLPHCEDPAFFTRADTECGGFFPETCTCGSEYQNSHLTVLEEVGKRRTPIDLPPRLRIQSPEPLDGVEQGFFVVATATDDDGIRDVELFMDDVLQVRLQEPPFAFATPIDWPLGPVSIRVVATNILGRTSTATRQLEVRARPPDFDGGFLDAAGPRPDAGEPSWSDWDGGVAEAQPARVVDPGGCECVVAPSDAPVGLGLAVALLLFMRPRRRRGGRAMALLGLVTSLSATAACESETVRALNPELESKPVPGSVIDFGEMILDEPRPRPAHVRISNVGQASLVLGEAVVSPSASGAFSLTGPLRSTVDPRGSTEMLVDFKPVRPGPLEGEISIDTNDPDYPTLRFPIQGRVRERCRLEPWPTAIDFTLGAEREVSLLSASTSPCVVTGLSLDEAIFELLDPPALPLELEPGAELRLTIRHHTRSLELHVPKRDLRVFERESEGTQVRLIGAYPVWNCLTAYPEEQEFPQTAAGATSRLLFTVTNRCLEAAEISSVGLPYGGEAFRSIDLPEPLSVPARGSVGLAMDFQPPEGLDYFGRARINTNDSANRQLYVGMIGRAIGPVFSAPNRLDLGAVPFPSPSGVACATPSRALPIFNLGNGGLRVHALELEGADATAFAIEDVQLDGVSIAAWSSGFDVPPHAHAEVLVRFEPNRAAPDAHEAALIVRHTPGATEHRVALHGRALGAADSVDSFLVDRAEVDVLFAVDGSRSMTAKHRSLADHILELIERADAETSSNQIGLISMRKERPDAGRLLTCRFRDAVLASGAGSPAERADDFNCALALNALDERPQAGLLGAALALGRSAFPTERDPTSFDNQRFLRDDAHLALIFVSDEDDVAKGEVELFHQLYRAAKGGRSDRLRVHSIVVPPGMACTNERYSVPGLRYSEVASLAGGTVEDICAPDLDDALEQIAGEVFAPPRGFALSNWPDPASVEVFVNGAAVAVDPTNGYTLDRQTNTVVFAPSAAPTRGSLVELHYRSVCGF